MLFLLTTFTLESAGKITNNNPSGKKYFHHVTEIDTLSNTKQGLLPLETTPVSRLSYVLTTCLFVNLSGPQRVQEVGGGHHLYIIEYPWGSI